MRCRGPNDLVQTASALPLGESQGAAVLRPLPAARGHPATSDLVPARARPRGLRRYADAGERSRVSDVRRNQTMSKRRHYSEQEFEELVSSALDALPHEFQSALEHVAIVVSDR